MKVKSVQAMLLVGAMCASCVENQNQTNSRSGNTLAGAADTTKAGTNPEGEVRLPQAPVTPVAPLAAATVGPVAKPVVTPAAASDVPAAPKDAQWTLYCATFKDADHVEASREMKATLLAKSGMREWYLVHENNQSRLYYGFYRSISDADSDPAETARAKSDRLKIDGMTDAGGQRPFRACQFVQLASPDPESPAEWNLLNAPRDRVWTLMIGAYKDHPDRKKFAVDAVREARAQGIEAYYYHGDNVSNVFVGTWPASAVQETRVDAKQGVRTRQDPVLVLPPGMKADGRVRNKEGAVRAVGVDYKPVDPKLLEAISQYPNMGVNGEFLKITSGGKSRLQGSMVIQIPRSSELTFAENNNAAAGADANAANERPYGEPQYSNPQQGAASNDPRDPDAVKIDPGRLRSIGRVKK